MTPLTEVNGVGPILARLMAQLGIASVADLSSAKAELLVALPGVGLRRAESLIDAARALTQSPEFVPAPIADAPEAPAPADISVSEPSESVAVEKKKKKKAKPAAEEKPAKSGKKKKKKGAKKSNKKA